MNDNYWQTLTKSLWRDLKKIGHGSNYVRKVNL
jgi:hypothetical protein